MANSTRVDDIDDPNPSVAEPANLRFLRRLVTVLTVVMILGVVVIAAALVIRLTQPTAIAMPDQIVLPAKARALAVTEGPDWYGIVTSDQQFLVFDKLTGQLRQTVQIRGQ